MLHGLITINTITNMITTIALALLVLWLLGFLALPLLGGFVHILLIVAVIMLIIRLVQNL